jgi:hypothetical protein
LNALAFAIYLLPPIQLGPDGQRMGQITIGKFTEQFACHPTTATVDQMETVWQGRLRALIAGERTAVLKHDPRFAWVIYREGNNCFVQQRLSVNGAFRDILPRRVLNDDRHEISEWSVTVAQISDFLDRCDRLGAPRS